MKIKFFAFKGLRFVFCKIKSRISKSLRLELIFLVALCFIGSIVLGLIAGKFFDNINYSQSGQIDYTYGKKEIDKNAQEIVNRFENDNFSTSNTKDIQDLIDTRSKNTKMDILIVDIEGNVLFSAGSISSAKIDIFNTLEDLQKLKDNTWNEDEAQEYKCMYPLKLSDKNTYLIVSAIPHGQIVYNGYGTKTDFEIFIACVAAFILIFLFAIKKKMQYIENISNGLIEISKGDLDYRVDKKGEDELAGLACNINYMASEIKNKIESERKAEKTKSDLITNVSHDLRTPLTSIMGYIGLLKMKKYNSEEQQQEYLEIAYNKSEKLKALIENLFEYTKLSNEGVKLYKNEVILNEFLDQVIEELVPIAEDNSITLKREIPKERITVSIDAEKMQRVFENLIANAVKYSYKPGDVKIILSKEDGNIKICIQNHGDNIPPEEISMLFDRFYRVEKSRSSETGGSGLGLAIAKSIVELHGGKIWAECSDNVISLIVCLGFA